MSIKALVRLKLNNENINLDEKIDFSFEITGLAVKHKIGTNFGGNISSAFSDLLKSLKKDEILFELTDDPMDINAENLLSGECEIDTSTIHVALVYESLSSRMTRIQSFFEELLKNKLIKDITLDIDALETNNEYNVFETINLTIGEFCSKMLELYKKENQITPTVRIHLKK